MAQTKQNCKHPEYDCHALPYGIQKGDCDNRLCVFNVNFNVARPDRPRRTVDEPENGSDV